MGVGVGVVGVVCVCVVYVLVWVCQVQKMRHLSHDMCVPVHTARGVFVDFFFV